MRPRHVVEWYNCLAAKPFYRERRLNGAQAIQQSLPTVAAVPAPRAAPRFPQGAAEDKARELLTIIRQRGCTEPFTPAPDLLDEGLVGCRDGRAGGARATGKQRGVRWDDCGAPVAQGRQCLLAVGATLAPVCGLLCNTGGAPLTRSLVKRRWTEISTAFDRAQVDFLEVAALTEEQLRNARDAAAKAAKESRSCAVLVRTHGGGQLAGPSHGCVLSS